MLDHRTPLPGPPTPATPRPPRTAPRRRAARAHRAPGLRAVAVVLLALYLVVLASAVFLPLPFQQLPRGEGATWELELRHPDVLRSWETQRNVLMTVPFGLLLPLVVRWRYEALVAACVALTLVVETVQLTVSVAVGWSWRAFDVNDLLLNTIGGVVGLALTGAVLLAARRTTVPPAHRLVPGALAAAVVAWAAVASVPTPAPPPPTPALACDEAPVGAVTELPGDARAHAGSDGSVCLSIRGGATAVPTDVDAGPALIDEGPDGTWEVGAAQPADAAGTGVPDADLHAVDGSPLLVWSVRR